MIRKIIRKIILREKSDSESYIKYLRSKDMQIGEDVLIYSPQNTLIDMTAPWMVSIGDHVRITHGVIILTHDYSWSVLKNYSTSKGSVIGAQSKVSIGNNVFIGMNSIITRGVTINDNVIIGAGSVVTGDCEADSVYAGNPARKIMSLDEFFEKRKSKQTDEAKEIALGYYRKFGNYPPKEVFKEYFMLFETAESAPEIPQFRLQMETGMNYEDSIRYMHSHIPEFESYEKFLAYCTDSEEKYIEAINMPQEKSK